MSALHEARVSGLLRSSRGVAQWLQLPRVRACIDEFRARHLDRLWEQSFWDGVHAEFN